MAAFVAYGLVSFAAPTDSAERLLPKLGAAVGLRLEARRLAREQVLLIQVRGMERNRLLRLVADTTGGTHRRRGAGRPPGFPLLGALGP